MLIFYHNITERYLDEYDQKVGAFTFTAQDGETNVAYRKIMEEEAVLKEDVSDID